jgi:hypothetical protein
MPATSTVNNSLPFRIHKKCAFINAQYPHCLPSCLPLIQLRHFVILSLSSGCLFRKGMHNSQPGFPAVNGFDISISLIKCSTLSINYLLIPGAPYLQLTIPSQP